MIGAGGYHESKRCSRDTHPESYITKYTGIRITHMFHISLLEHTCVFLLSVGTGFPALKIQYELFNTRASGRWCQCSTRLPSLFIYYFQA